MRNYGKKKNYCLIAALASLVAFSTMAASVMSGCGENSDEQKATEIVHETRIDTQIKTKIETYTEVVTDAQGNTEYVKETKAVPVNNNAGGNSKSGDSGNNSENSGGSSSGKNSSSQQSSVIEKSETSKTTNNSSSKTDSGKTNNNSNKNNNNSNKNNNSNDNSNKNNNSSSSKSDSSKSDDSNSKSLKIGGKTFNVGDTIVCTYKLKTPAVLENYQARIKYDSSKLTCKSAKMSEPAKNGAMLNIKIAGEISISGVNIGDGYDYTNGGTFMTVVYEVKGGGSTSPSYHWEVACRASDSKNLIDKKGKPASGFKLSSSYKD